MSFVRVPPSGGSLASASAGRKRMTRQLKLPENFRLKAGLKLLILTTYANFGINEPLAKLFVLRTNATSFIAYLLVNLHKLTCSVGSSRHGAAEGEDGRTEIR